MNVLIESQSLKLFGSIVSSPSGKITPLSDVQHMKAPFPTTLVPSCKTADLNESQYAKHSELTFSTLPGMSIDCNFECQNAFWASVWSVLGSSMFLRDEF